MSLRLMTSRNGRVGMVPEKAIKGDLVCILFGCSVPVLLRRTEHEEQFTVVGECFLDQCMAGQSFRTERLLGEDILYHIIILGRISRTRVDFYGFECRIWYHRLLRYRYTFASLNHDTIYVVERFER